MRYREKETAAARTKIEKHGKRVIGGEGRFMEQGQNKRKSETSVTNEI